MPGSPKLSAGRVHDRDQVEDHGHDQQLMMGHDEEAVEHGVEMAPPLLVLEAGPVHNAGGGDPIGPVHHAEAEAEAEAEHGEEEAGLLVVEAAHGDAGGFPPPPVEQAPDDFPVPPLEELIAEPLKLAEVAHSMRDYMPVLDPTKIYVSISVMQRGDFHKFKWSMAASHLFHVFIPINARNEARDIPLHKEQLYKAQTLEKLAPGQWSFINSFRIASKFDNSEIEAERFKLIGLQSEAIKDMGGLANMPADEETGGAALMAWSQEAKEAGTIYDINSFVPFFNSDMVKESRAEILDDEMSEHVGSLLDAVREGIEGRDVLVLWGNRTGGGKQYMRRGVAAREFRHKTSQELYQELAKSAGAKVVLTAGDPLDKVPAAFNFTEMWGAEAMMARFGIDHSFDRMEQEAFFYHLAKLASSTLHIGMQSGNIEPLINNPNTNVLCINENSKGGAGLTNVDKISAQRETAATRKIEDVAEIAPEVLVPQLVPAEEEAGEEEALGLAVPEEEAPGLDYVPPGQGVENLYLSFKMSVLPSFIGQLSRMLMEAYGESISFDGGIKRLLVENGLNAEFESEDLTGYVAQYIRTVVPPQAYDGSKHSMLENFDASDVNKMIIELYNKFLRQETEELLAGMEEVVEDDPAALPVGFGVEKVFRPEVQLLKELVGSNNPRVQYMLKSLAELATTHPETLQEKAFNKLFGVISSNKGTFFLPEFGNDGAMPNSWAEKIQLYITQGEATIASLAAQPETQAPFQASVANLTTDLAALLALEDEESITLLTLGKNIQVDKVNMIAKYRATKHNGIGRSYDRRLFSDEDLLTIKRAGVILNEQGIQDDIDIEMGALVPVVPVEDLSDDDSDDDPYAGGFGLWDDLASGSEDEAEDDSPTESHEPV